MKNVDLLNAVAPCSLICFTCSAYSEGVICNLSTQLHNYLEGYADFLTPKIPLMHRELEF